MKIKSYLHIKIIYKDSDMLEIEASASNGKFSGVTKTYVEADGKRLTNLGQILLNFPQDVEQKVVCEFGADENYLKSVNETKKKFPKVLAHLSYINFSTVQIR